MNIKQENIVGFLDGNWKHDWTFFSFQPVNMATYKQLTLIIKSIPSRAFFDSLITFTYTSYLPDCHINIQAHVELKAIFFQMSSERGRGVKVSLT